MLSYTIIIECPQAMELSYYNTVYVRISHVILALCAVMREGVQAVEWWVWCLVWGGA